MNKAILIGRLGKDPETKQFDSGSMVAEFSLATSEKFKNQQGEKKEETQWHNVKVWGKQAEIVEKYLRKGDQVMIEGKITYRVWGEQEKKYITEIIAERFEMLGSKQDRQQTAAAISTSTDSAADDPDDLPF